MTVRRMEDYIGLSQGRDFAEKVIGIARKWTKNTMANGMMKQWRENYRLYHNAEPSGEGWNDDSFSVTGDNGEFVKVRFNQFRNLIQHILNMNINSPPPLKSKAINSEPKSLMDAQLYDGVLVHYMSNWRQARFAKQYRKAAELSLLMSNGYLLFEWDTTAGRPYIIDEQGSQIRQGDLYCKAFSVFDVFFDTNIEDESELYEVVIRDYGNRFELANNFRDHSDKILGLESKTEVDMSYHWNFDKDTDLIPVYKYYRKSSPLMPQGRFAIVLDDDTVLYDGPNPYTDEFGEAIIPLVTIRASEGLGTLYGYSPANDLAPIQVAYNMMMSTAVTSYAAFGVQNIVVDRGSDISVSSLSGGMNLIEKNSSTMTPEGLNLTKLPEGYFDFVGLLKSEGETESGVNSVVRGDPEASLKSGKSLNIVAGAAAQFMSGFQNSITQGLQDSGNLMLRIFKLFASTPQMVAIVGKDKMIKSKEWSSQNLQGVATVAVEIIDPAFRTLAFKEKMADFMVEKGLVSNPQEYITLMTTGQLEPLYRGEMAQLNLIHQENEDMMQMKQPKVLRTDNHTLHISEHGAEVASPDIRNRDDELEVYLDHINWHERAMTGDLRDPQTFKQEMAMQQMLMAQQQVMTVPPQPGQMSVAGPPIVQPNGQSIGQMNARPREPLPGQLPMPGMPPPGVPQ